MLLKDICPYVRVANIFILDHQTQNDIFNNLKTVDCRLFYIISGSGSIIVQNKLCPLSAGSIILFQSGTKYCWQPDEEGIKYVAINFDYTQNFMHHQKSFHPSSAAAFDNSMILETITFTDAAVLNQPIFLTGKSKFEGRFRFLSTELYMGGAFCHDLLSSELKSLIYNIVRETLAEKNDVEKAIIRKTIEYIQTNFDKKISNDTIAENFGFHPTYLNRLFKQQTGNSIHQFVLNYRITIAADLLISSNLSVEQVAEHVGFGDIPHFSKMFKSKMGIVPSKFKSSLY